MEDMRLIDAYEADKFAKENLQESVALAIRGFIAHCPTVETKPVEHGRWVLEESHLFWDSPGQRLICNKCYYTHQYKEWFNFCPNCGCRMDGDEDE